MFDFLLKVGGFANVIAFGNPRAKAAIVEKTAAIVPTVHKQKPQLITKHVLPRAVRLVEDPDGAMRTACSLLLQSLAAEGTPRRLVFSAAR